MRKQHALQILGLAGAMLMAAPMAVALARDGGQIPLAIADFDYTDT